MALVNESDRRQLTGLLLDGGCCLRFTFSVLWISIWPEGSCSLVPLPAISRANWTPSAISTKVNIVQEQGCFQHLMHQTAFTVIRRRDGKNQLYRLPSQGSLWKPLWLLVVKVNCTDVFKSVSLVTRKLLCQNDRWAVSSSSALPVPCDVSSIYLSRLGIFVAPHSTSTFMGNLRKISSVACSWPTGMRGGWGPGVSRSLWVEGAGRRYLLTRGWQPSKVGLEKKWFVTTKCPGRTQPGPKTYTQFPCFGCVHSLLPRQPSTCTIKRLLEFEVSLGSQGAQLVTLWRVRKGAAEIISPGSLP